MERVTLWWFTVADMELPTSGSHMWVLPSCPRRRSPQETLPSHQSSRGWRRSLGPYLCAFCSFATFMHALTTQRHTHPHTHTYSKPQKNSVTVPGSQGALITEKSADINSLGQISKLPCFFPLFFLLLFDPFAPRLVYVQLQASATMNSHFQIFSNWREGGKTGREVYAWFPS